MSDMSKALLCQVCPHHHGSHVATVVVAVDVVAGDGFCHWEVGGWEKVL